MKNSVLLLLSIIIILTVLPWGKQTEAEREYQVIPDEAIRLRILADSNAEKDQEIKRLVRDRVNEEITVWVEDLTSIEAARQLIQQRIPNIQKIVGDTLAEQGIEDDYSADYDSNVSFPTKLYGSYIYPAGDYEAILITIGEGKGDNWWCVLFPPLCFLDFSNGTSVAEEPVEEEQEEEEDVQFFVLTLWEKLFS
ncbi:stage II sporulation protein R [Halobacillus locisalis]|uniref:Stage II sporulation protein R n=1 Tax=Halobacillus locisalis TaxID=220753 RepID=A0A838CTD5_9BACI|nr:stage II sporulation protein R [Halobacillus locisalis]MBA2175260.1 stage II sporulation protein R [Halobacillus locisalis]